MRARHARTRRLAEGAGIAMHIETHRDRMTTDLFFTLHLLDRFPDLRLALRHHRRRRR
jgi:hypothetical protein